MNCPPPADPHPVVTAPPPDAHRKICHLYDYWRRLAPAAAILPGRRHVDPLDIPALLENVWLVDVLREPLRFRFRLVGDAMRRMGVPGKAGDFVETLVPPDSLPLTHFRHSVHERSPVWFRGQATMRHRAEMVELERIFLPLAADGATVDMVLGLTVFYLADGRDV